MRGFFFLPLFMYSRAETWPPACGKSKFSGDYYKIWGALFKKNIIKL